MADDAGADLIDRPPWLPRAQYPFTVRHRDEPGGAVAYVDEGVIACDLDRSSGSTTPRHAAGAVPVSGPAHERVREGATLEREGA